MNANRIAGLGFFVVLGFLLFGTGLFLIGDRRQLFSDNFELYTEFSNIAGIETGSTVRVSGKDAGEVLEVHIPPGPQARFRVKMRILEELHGIVRMDSVASIQTEGVVGNKFLQIDAGSAAAKQAPPGSTIPSREPFDITDLLQQARDSVASVTTSITTLTGELQETLSAATVTIQNTNDVIVDAGGNVKRIMANGERVSRNLQLITADINEMIGNSREGKGTIGRLVYDEKLYEEIQQIATSARVSMQNLQQVTQKANEAIGQLQTKDQNGENFSVYLRDTLKNTNEVMADMADNMEALKRNWFFRRFYTGRGFYDLDSISLPAYREGVLLTKDRATRRQWIPATSLFENEKESAAISEKGRAEVRKSMAEFLRYQITGAILMIEGYSSEGQTADQYLASRTRALAVRDYLVKEFNLDTNVIGIMPMGALRSEDNQPYDGVSLVLFYDKSVKPTP